MMNALARSTPVTLAVITTLVAAFVAAGVGLFKLTVGGAIALYFVVWWTLLFAVLPLRNQPETRPSHVVPGQDPGAPAAPATSVVQMAFSRNRGAAFLIALAVFPLTGL
jgi:predicted secreted protein